MTQQPFGDYLKTKDKAIHAQLEIINGAILKAVPKIDTAIKWMDPLCAIDTTKKGITLRFMSGDELSDPLGVLRFASSSMGSWDIPFDAKIKPADITKYVKEAAKNHQNREK